MAKNNNNFTHRVQFNLRKYEPSNSPQDIHAIIRFNNQRLVISGIEKCEPRFWNCAKNKSNPKNYNTPKQSVENKRARAILVKMNDAKTKISEVFDSYIKENNSYPKDLKAFQYDCRSAIFDLKSRSQKTEQEKSPSILAYVSDFVKDMKAGRKIISVGKKRGQLYSVNSLKTYSNLLFNLSSYSKYAGLKDIEFNDIDLEFYTELRNYMVIERNLSPAYFGDTVKSLKAIMSDSLEKEYHENRKFQSRHFVKETTEADTIFLDNEKLSKLLHFDFSNKPFLDKARNLFLVGAYSGLRFSDFSTIKPENISDDYIRVRTQKTKDYVSIPISSDLREVLNRYSDGRIETISNQKLNSYIKDVCKEAGFTDMVSIKKYNRGKEIHVNVPFYSLVTTHTARRTFASNAFKAGYPTLLIMAITTHKTEAAFLKYIRLSNEDKSAMMLELMKRNELKAINGGLD